MCATLEPSQSICPPPAIHVAPSNSSRRVKSVTRNGERIRIWKVVLADVP
jgi:hypothetical protein